MGARKQPETELELRARFAAVADARARSTCVVGRATCRAGDDEGDWFDLVEASTRRTYTFCAAHSLAAELLGTGGLLFDGTPAAEIVQKIRALEEKRERELG